MTIGFEPQQTHDDQAPGEQHSTAPEAVSPAETTLIAAEGTREQVSIAAPHDDLSTEATVAKEADTAPTVPFKPLGAAAVTSVSTPKTPEHQGMFAFMGTKAARIGTVVVAAGAVLALGIGIGSKRGEGEPAAASPAPVAATATPSVEAPAAATPSVEAATATQAPTPTDTKAVTPSAEATTQAAAANPNALSKDQIDKYLDDSMTPQAFYALPKEVQLQVIASQYETASQNSYTRHLGTIMKTQGSHTYANNHIYNHNPLNPANAESRQSTPQDIVNGYTYRLAYAGAAQKNIDDTSVNAAYSPVKAQKDLAGVYAFPETDNFGGSGTIKKALANATLPSELQDGTYTAVKQGTDPEARDSVDENGKPIVIRNVAWTEADGTMLHESVFRLYNFNTLSRKQVSMWLMWKDSIVPNVK